MRRSLLTAALLSVWPLSDAQAEKLVADEWYQLEMRDQSERRVLQHKTLPGLVQIQRFKTELVAPDFASSHRTFRGTASLVVSGSLTHPFSTAVNDPIIRIGFFSHQALARAWQRLTATPLMLTEHELRQALPHPSFHWVQDASHDGVFAPDSKTKIQLETQFTNVRLQMRALPELLVMIDGYNLEDPSPEDLRKIIEDGGVVDFTAAATWAHSVLLERPDWPEAERKKLIQSLSGVLKKMRPPLAHGALARLNALTSIMQAVAKPQDLEELLSASENVAVLMTSVGLTYYDSVREETEFDLPIHQIKSLPSLQEFLKSFTHGLQGVRSHALAELVRLSFDPLDFRHAPKSAFTVSEVQKHAKELLEPLSALNVNQLMLHVGENTDKQLKLLNFYVNARHAPVIATLLHWLHKNPDHVDSLGKNAAAKLGVQIVPALLRTFLEPIDPREREISRTMLLALAPEAQRAAIDALRGTGVILEDEIDIAEAVKAFEVHEQKALNRKADLLEQSIFTKDPNPKDAVLRMNLLADLARGTPERIEGRAKEIFPLLALVAKQTMQSAPVHSERALSMFSTLPFGAYKNEAHTQLTLTKVGLLESQGKLRKAIKVLYKEAPRLDNPHLRLKYSELSRQVIRNAIHHGKYAIAGRTLKKAKDFLPEDDRFEILEQELFVSRYKIAFVLGAIAVFSMVVSGAYVAARRLNVALRSMLKRRRSGTKARVKSSAPANNLEATQLGGPPPDTNEEFDHEDDFEEGEAGQNPATDSEDSVAVSAPPRSFADDFADDFDDELDRMEEEFQGADEPDEPGLSPAPPDSPQEPPAESDPAASAQEPSENLQGEHLPVPESDTAPNDGVNPLEKVEDLEFDGEASLDQAPASTPALKNVDDLEFSDQVEEDGQVQVLNPPSEQEAPRSDEDKVPNAA